MKIDACGFPIREKEETACGYLERCLAPDMRHVWYEACDEIKKAMRLNGWKPSEEQMKALERAEDYLIESDNEDAEIIGNLYNDLEKQMEE